MNPYLHLRRSLSRPLFIPFAVLGDPDPKRSLTIIEALIANGADALELGLPFSDPPADGPVIQAADKRALDAVTTTDDCFSIISKIRTKHALPIGLLVYFNLMFKLGIDRFYKDCKASGVTSVLVADLPLEHFEEVAASARKYKIAPVFMVSERTTDARLKKIAKIAGGYLYLVSYLGITGATNAVLESKIRTLIRRCRKATNLPLCVGFGISKPEHVRAVVSAGSDGVIVGSRIVEEVPDIGKIVTICKQLKSACCSQPRPSPPGPLPRGGRGETSRLRKT